MERKLSYIKERILQIAMHKGIAKEKFIENLGMTYGSFKGENKKSSVNSDFLDNLLTNYQDINAEWLISGSGEMLKQKDSKQSSKGNIREIYTPGEIERRLLELLDRKDDEIEDLKRGLAMKDQYWVASEERPKR